MDDTPKHEGYLGTVRYSADDHLFYGKVESIRTLDTFEGTDVASLESAFVEAVDDDLETCRELGGTPKKPLNGGTRWP